MSKFYGNYSGRFGDHFKECKEYFKESEIVMLALTGSQNYGLDTKDSDIDTKLTVLPCKEDIFFNKPAVSTTHIRDNEEHIDFKDIRLMLPTLLKQNVNYLEQLFSTQYLINEDYSHEIDSLLDIREDIARFYPHKCIMTMYGIAMGKKNRIFRELPEKKDIFTYGYNPKEAMQLFRIEEFLRRYINDEPFEDCLRSQQREHLLLVKSGVYDAHEMVDMVNVAIAHVEEMKEDYFATHEETYKPGVQIVVYDVQKRIMERYLKNVFNNR